MEQLTFCVFAGITLLAALGVVLLRNVLHSALMLGICLLGVAGLFARLGADFLFASQILIYVGGIAVLVLFVVLLAGRSSELITRQINSLWLAAAILCVGTIAGLQSFIKPYHDVVIRVPAIPTTKALGLLLMNDLAVPFEMISLILLAALAGAVVFSKAEPHE